MKSVKVKFVGLWAGFVPEDLAMYEIMKKYYNVVITDDDPDYIICSCFKPVYDYCRYPQIRIMISSENYIPDFNLVDYGVSRYPVVLQDRSFRIPGCIDGHGHYKYLAENPRNFGPDDLKKKQFFASFIAGHESEYGIRGDFFKQLSKYKRVESPGSYLNNMPDNSCVSWSDSSKTDFQRKCKFSLCFESTKNEGFITEKITDAFYADTIPVYFGSSDVKSIFNEDAFIFCESRDDFDRTIERIIELDNNDGKYLEMLNRPVFNKSYDTGKVMRDYEVFVRHIFDQPVEEAYRRSRVYAAMDHERFLNGLEHSSISGREAAAVLANRIKARITGKE